jgi:hypothetical protein
MTAKAYREGVYTSSDCGSYHSEVKYIPTPAFNARWFIEERLKKEANLFKKYPELGNPKLFGKND